MILPLLLVSAAYAGVLELDMLQNATLKNMPLLLEAEAKIRAAASELTASQGAFDHKLKLKTFNQFENKYDNQSWDARLERQTSLSGLKLFAGQRQGTGLFPVYDTKYETSSIGELFAGIDIPLLRDRQMDEPRIARERARQKSLEARFRWQQKSLEVLLKSGEAYWKWVANGQKLRILRDWVKTANERQLFLEKKVKAGDTSAIKLVDNRRSLAKRRAELVKAERDFAIATQVLVLYSGEKTYSLEQVPAEINLSDDEINQPEDATRDQLPPFQIIDSQEKLLDKEKTFARSQVLPDFRLSLEGVRDLGALPTSQTDPDQLRVGLQMEIPLENNKGEGKREQVSAKIAALRHLKNWLVREWHNRLSQNRVSLVTTREQLALQTSEVTDTARMAQAEVQRLQQGDSDIFFVNIREQDEAEARLRWIETKALHEIGVLERHSLDGALLKKILAI